MDKSAYEEIIKDLKNEFNIILSNHTIEIQSLKDEVKNLKLKVENLQEKVKNLENENKLLKSNLAQSEKKIKILVILIDAIRNDMEAFVDIGKDFSNNLDKASEILLNVKYALDKYDIELENLGNIIS